MVGALPLFISRKYVVKYKQGFLESEPNRFESRNQSNSANITHGTRVVKRTYEIPIMNPSCPTVIITTKRPHLITIDAMSLIPCHQNPLQPMCCSQ